MLCSNPTHHQERGGDRKKKRGGDSYQRQEARAHDEPLRPLPRQVVDRLVVTQVDAKHSGHVLVAGAYGGLLLLLDPVVEELANLARVRRVPHLLDDPGQPRVSDVAIERVERVLRGLIADAAQRGVRQRDTKEGGELQHDRRDEARALAQQADADQLRHPKRRHGGAGVVQESDDDAHRVLVDASVQEDDAELGLLQRRTERHGPVVAFRRRERIGHVQRCAVPVLCVRSRVRRKQSNDAQRRNQP